MITLALANQYLQQQNYQQAETSFKQLLSKNKDHIEALWGLSEVAFALNSHQRAYQLLVRCLHLNSSQIKVYLSLVKVCRALRQFDKVEQALITAHKLSPKSITVLLELAAFYSEAGNYQQANDFLQQVTHIEPVNVRAFALLVRLNRVVFDADNVSDYCRSMLLELSNPDLNTTLKVLLHYSFYELYDGNGLYKQAFTHLQLANQIQYQHCQFTVADMKQHFNQIISTFKPSLFCQSSSENKPIIHPVDNENDKFPIPIFIVGQPRSGSTLLEQMLVNHQSIETAGELSLMADDIGKGIYQLTGKHFPDGVALLKSQQKQLLAQHYLKQLAIIAPNSRFVIDKMPANYQSIGLIKLLFPQAKVIHIKRSPLAVSWSIFSNNFAVQEPYFCSLDDIVNYHEKYELIMAHWQQTIPNFIHTIDYESLVQSPDTKLAQLLEFCGLELQSQCLSLGITNRHINTLSDRQLRRGIDNSLPKKWVNYQQYLSPLLQAFPAEK